MEKKLFLALGIFLAVVIMSSSFVVAGAYLTSPTTGTNYTASFTFNCKHLNATGAGTIMNVTNATLWYYVNRTGGISGVLGNANTSVTTISNTTAATYSMNQTYWNTTVDASGLPSGFYNFTCELRNATDSLNATSNTTIIVDTVNPNVSSVVYPSGNGTYTGLDGVIFYINVTISDDMDSYINTSVYDRADANGIKYNQSAITNVYFTLTNSAGIVLNATNAIRRSSTSSTWYGTINITNTTANRYVAGRYNLTIYVNDTAGNTNNSEVLEFFIDSVAPTVTVARKDVGTSSTSIAMDVTITDYSSSTCTSSRGAASFTNQYTMLTETGLSCGTEYTYTITCTDAAGNAGASSATALSTLSCSSSSGGGGGGGGSAQTWTNTYSVTNEQFEAGYTKQLAKKQRMKVKVGDEDHYVGVKALTLTEATIEIASDPVTVKLEIGGEAKVDVMGDGFYDVLVKLNSIVNNKADVTVTSIHEEVPETEEGEGEGTDVKGGEILEDSNFWIWVIVIVVVIIVIGAGVGIKKKRR